jgi:hypothetical protein
MDKYVTVSMDGYLGVSKAQVGWESRNDSKAPERSENANRADYILLKSGEDWLRSLMARLAATYCGLVICDRRQVKPRLLP